MFVGSGMRRPVSGLGILEATPTGLAVRASPTCVTAAEKAEAQSKCRTISLHGLGQASVVAMAPMTGRLVGFSPCDVRDLPICPTPKCIDDATAMMIMKCMAGETVDGVNCKDPVTAFALAYYSQVPYCDKPAFLPMPDCTDPAFQDARKYCLANPTFQGPNGAYNAACWAIMHDPSYWQTISSKRTCSPPVVNVPKPPPAAPPPVVVSPPAMTPPTSTPPTPEDVPPPVPTQTSESGAMGVFGILALVAAAGGGYYLYRRYKR